MHAYLSLDEMRLRLDIPDTDHRDDVTIRRALEAASRKVDNLCSRRFQPQVSTRYLTAEWPDEIEVDDLLDVTSLTTLTSNSDGNRVYGQTWASTDYDLLPYDAPDYATPYTAIARNPAGRYTFPLDARGVEITGIWGYWLETEAIGTLGAGLNDSSTSVTVAGDGSAYARLQTLLIGDEAVYVTGVTPGEGTSTLTVLRAQNGTTAATHSNGAAVSVYRYPEPIVEATALFAQRQFRRSDAPLGVAGSDMTGTTVRIASRETDAIEYLRDYRRFHGTAVR